MPLTPEGHAAVASMSWSDIIAALSAVGAVIGFGWGIKRYFSSENWKRSEFVAAQIKEFHSDKINEAVLRMMDYDPARIELFPDKPNEAKYVNVSLDTLINAINKEDDLIDIELEIREYFEHFLICLSRLNYFMDRGAIKLKELCADFSYIVDVMTGKERQLKLENSRVDIAPRVLTKDR